MPILRCGRFPFLSKVCSEARLGSKATVAWMRSICHRVACRWPVPLDQMRQRHREAPNLEKQSQIRTQWQSMVHTQTRRTTSVMQATLAEQCTGLKVVPLGAREAGKSTAMLSPDQRHGTSTCTSCSFSIELEQKTLAAYNPTFLRNKHTRRKYLGHHPRVASCSSYAAVAVLNRDSAAPAKAKAHWQQDLERELGYY